MTTVREIVIKALKESLVGHYDGDIDNLDFNENIKDQLDSLDFAETSLKMDDKLQLDSSIVNSDPALWKVTTFEDLIQVYIENYNGTVYDE